MKTLLCLLMVFSVSAFAETKLTYSGDAYVRGYFKNTTSPPGTRAFNQFFRFNVNVKPDENLSVKMGAILSSNTWEGDNHKSLSTGGTAMGGTNDDGFSNDNITRLDHAVIEYNKNNWITSVGRHAVSTPGNFLTSDDRRDRIQVVKILESYDAVAFAYDKRAEGALNNSEDDLDMYSLNYYGAFSTFKYALQTGYWRAKDYKVATSGLNTLNLDEVKQFTPQIEGKVLGLDFNLYYTILFDGKMLYPDTHHSGALKLGHDFEVVKVEAQSMVTVDGGLIAGGFDSLSSLVNNSPDHNQSSIKLKTIGFGLGDLGSDETLHMLKISKNFTSDFSMSVGGGYGKFWDVTTQMHQRNTLADATAKYAFSPNFSLTALYGHFFGDYKDHAGSLTLKAVF